MSINLIINKFKHFIFKKIFKYNRYNFPEYIPNSAGSFRTIEELLKINIQNFSESVLNVFEQFDESKILDIDYFQIDTKLENQIKLEFEKNKSDKVDHGYHIIYSYIFSNLTISSASNLLEIGIGSNNKMIPSHMKKNYLPGASLVSYSNLYPNLNIYGGDIDTDIFIDKKNIVCLYIDQNDLSSFNNEIIKSVNFDIIIDDGLHMQSANLNTLSFALQNLKSGGFFLIEDIPSSAIKIWKAFYIFFKKMDYEIYLIKAYDNFAVLIKNK